VFSLNIGIISFGYHLTIHTGCNKLGVFDHEGAREVLYDESST